MIAIRLIWNRKAIPLPGAIGLRDVYVDPEPEYPAGRKGLVLANTWKMLRHAEGELGMFIVDGDVVLDPKDFEAMRKAAWGAPHEVHIAPIWIWPISTGLDQPIRGHGHDFYGEGLDEPITRFSFCCTYLPEGLIWDCIDAGLEKWTFPNVDKSVSKVAAKEGWPINLVEDCWPKHMNF